MAQGVLIFGGTRETGLETARLLRARGEAVTGLVRPESDPSDLEETGATIVRGDVLNRTDVDNAFAAGDFRAVVNSIGASPGQKPRPDLDGTINIVDAAVAAGVRRQLMVTAIGAGNSRAAVAPKVLEVLGEVLELKTKAEAYLEESGLDYTILRPGGMTSDPASGSAIKTEDHLQMGVINRADLAALVVDCLDDDATIGRIYHTVDPEITWQAPLQRGDDSLHRR
ncbi:MAG: SDR family oxidoreductase [Gammaproteobacteria bacterium]|nr:SDR family oxidoreductase [Gammaproteobacteria bacterium]